MCHPLTGVFQPRRIEIPKDHEIGFLTSGVIKDTLQIEGVFEHLVAVAEINRSGT
jgi:hypothetical protein